MSLDMVAAPDGVMKTVVAWELMFVEVEVEVGVDSTVETGYRVHTVYQYQARKIVYRKKSVTAEGKPDTRTETTIRALQIQVVAGSNGMGKTIHTTNKKIQTTKPDTSLL